MRDRFSPPEAARLLGCSLADLDVLARAGHLAPLPDGSIASTDVGRLVTSARGGFGLGCVGCNAALVAFLAQALVGAFAPGRIAGWDPIVPIPVQVLAATFLVAGAGLVLVWQRRIVRPAVRARVQRLLAAARVAQG